MRNHLGRLVFLAWVIVIAGCSLVGREEGTLSGQVTIGPLRPASREGETEPTPSPELYAAWQIVVFANDMQRQIARAAIGPAGNYQVTLPAGTYMVTAEPASGSGGPAGSQVCYVEIFEGRVTELDLDIDTGIR